MFSHIDIENGLVFQCCFLLLGWLFFFLFIQILLIPRPCRACKIQQVFCNNKQFWFSSSLVSSGYLLSRAHSPDQNNGSRNDRFEWCPHGVQFPFAKAATQPGRRLSFFQSQSRVPQPLCLQCFLNPSCWSDSNSVKPLKTILIQRKFVQNMAKTHNKIFSHIDIENGLVFHCCFLTRSSFHIFWNYGLFCKFFSKVQPFWWEIFSLGHEITRPVRKVSQLVFWSLSAEHEWEVLLSGTVGWNPWTVLPRLEQSRVGPSSSYFGYKPQFSEIWEWTEDSSVFSLSAQSSGSTLRLPATAAWF